MVGLKRLVLGAVAVAGMGFGAESAFAGHTCSDICNVVLVPGHYETRMERIETPGRWVDEEKVVETPGRYETRYETVEIPGRYETVSSQVWVAGQWVGRSGPFVKIGSIDHVKIGFNLGGGREWVPGHYETTCQQVWIPPTCERRPVQVWVPGCRTVEIVRVWKPGCTIERPVQVWVPAKVEKRCPPAPVYRPAPRRGHDRTIPVRTGRPGYPGRHGS